MNVVPCCSCTGLREPARTSPRRRCVLKAMAARPHGWVEAIDCNSLGAAPENDNGEVEKQIEEAIAALKQRTGKSQVDVVGHSEGTKVMYHYLAESGNAAEHRKRVAA